MQVQTNVVEVFGSGCGFASVQGFVVAECFSRRGHGSVFDSLAGLVFWGWRSVPEHLEIIYYSTPFFR